MKTLTKYIIALLIVVIAAIVFYFKVYIPKTSYETSSPKIDSLSVEIYGIGTVDAMNIYPISSQTGGKILNILTDEGFWVKKGDLIAVIDPVDLPLLLEEAKASLSKAKYDVMAAKKSLESLISQKTLAQITYNRYEKLYKQKSVAKAEYDKADSDLQSIDAQTQASYATIDSKNAEIQRVQKSIEGLEVKLSRLNIHAPIEGYVISKDAQISQTVLSAQSIVKIVDPKTVWIKAYVDERISGKIRVNQKVVITLRSQNGKKFTGRVKRISAVSDAITQERGINISFDSLPIPFYINEQAQVTIATEVFKNIFTIDATLVSQKNGKSGVWISKNNRAYFQELDIVAHSKNFVGVKSGVDEMTKIIIPNKNKKSLFEGMRIHS